MNLKPYYQDSHATIYHGDCREILPQLPKVDLVLTDPPYGISGSVGYNSSFASRRSKWQRRKGHTPQDWDKEALNDIGLILSCGGSQIVWGGNYLTLPPSRGWLAWHKPDAPPTMASIELAWTCFNMNARLFSCSISATNAERVGHPTQKPLAVMLWCLGFAPLAQTIIDPFMGSGTTLVAAKQLGRKVIGIEIFEAYCEIAAKRLQQEYLPLASEPKPKIEQLEIV